MVAYSILVITIYILLHIHSGILIADVDFEHGRDHSFHREKVCTIDIYTFDQPSWFHFHKPNTICVTLNILYLNCYQAIYTCRFILFPDWHSFIALCSFFNQQALWLLKTSVCNAVLPSSPWRYIQYPISSLICLEVMIRTLTLPPLNKLVVWLHDYNHCCCFSFRMQMFRN